MPLGCLPSFADTAETTPQDNASNEATVSNTVSQTSESGSSIVTEGTADNDAISGPASTSVDLTTVVQGAVNTDTSDSPQIDHAVYTVYGQLGDVYINPSVLATPTVAPQNLTMVVSTQSTLSISNEVTAIAHSGDTLVEHSPQGGDAISGDSTVTVNITNVISSTVNAQASWVGVVTIYGDLQGNLVLPMAQINSQYPSSSALALPADSLSSYDIQNSTTLVATSGDATSNNNGAAEGAVTGSATTNISTYNIIHNSATTGNAWLIAVNVFGTWEGQILQAPVGTTLFYVTDTPSDQNPLTVSQVQRNNFTISNSVTANATTGNATVSDNAQAGKATTGNAVINAHIVNIISSHTATGGWFGLLTVNVYGNWIGSIVEPTQYENTDPDPVPVPEELREAQPTRVFERHFELIKRVETTTTAHAPPAAPSDVLGSTTNPTHRVPNITEGQSSWPWIVLFCLVASLIALRYYNYRRSPE